MKFYVITADSEGTIGCEFSLSKAVKTGKSYRTPFKVDRITINALSLREVVRRLLGNHGGYADDTETVYDSANGGNQETSTTEVQS